MGWTYMMNGITDVLCEGGPYDGRNFPMQFRDGEGKLRWLKPGEELYVKDDGQEHTYKYVRDEFCTVILEYQGLRHAAIND